MLYGEALYHLGIGVMCAAGVTGLLLAVIFRMTGRILRKKLDREYGEKRHK